MSDRLLKESDVIEAFKGRESLIHDVYIATAIIKSVPTADGPQGEWINYKDEHICSVCKEVVIGDWYCEDERYDFCPHCGARMKGADDDGKRD